MRNLRSACFIVSILLIGALALAKPKTMYCDSSSGRYILDNGVTSSEYCTIHGLMNLNKFSGFCIWHGGVAKTTATIVHCNDGTDSEMGSLQIPHNN